MQKTFRYNPVAAGFAPNPLRTAAGTAFAYILLCTLYHQAGWHWNRPPGRPRLRQLLRRRNHGQPLAAGRRPVPDRHPPSRQHAKTRADCPPTGPRPGRPRISIRPSDSDRANQRMNGRERTQRSQRPIFLCVLCVLLWPKMIESDCLLLRIASEQLTLAGCGLHRVGQVDVRQIRSTDADLSNFSCALLTLVDRPAA